MLSVKNLDVHYGKTKAISRVSLQVESGQVVALLGSNGAGKTTTLGAISGFVSPSAGEIFYEDKSLIGKKPYQMVKAGIIQVSQERDLFPELSVIENLRLGGIVERDKKKVLRVQEEILDQFPRLKERSEQKAGTLSGGEQQMLAIGRAMMSNPKLLLLDEPTIGLAPIFIRHIAKLLQSLKEKGTTMLLVEQNAPFATSLAHYFYVLRNGEMVAEGETKSLPQNVNEFLSKYYI